MSGNSNPSINSPALTDHELDTLVGDDAIITANLLQEFNDRQARHISVSSTELSAPYVPHSPTPSVQELPSPAPLRVRLTTAGVGHYPLISPGSAATLLRMEDCYGAAPTEGQRSLVNDREGLGSKRAGGWRRGSPHRLNRRLERSVD